MTPLLTFNSTVFVFWVTFFIPKAMEHDNKLLLWGSTVVMLVAEIWLGLLWSAREYPFNLLVAFATIGIGLIGGRVMHLFYQKLRKEDE